ncbi:carboxymuconolactone decarboxylase family protein [Actinomycetospora straminea]|uniref:Carboxymuconolactone decarboxylase family protein n=1 Tax=Actinomycetospora straminea TaxID=663607 RepID=A0ABP9E9P1_9PSEU|nr:carboxymuconolactone decarboxylase family protein [Actinomycetospora straminea]MDD7932017.1 carboxymuconolactone decarboxylase family protein [Actinomycetospora straminea]
MAGRLEHFTRALPGFGEAVGSMIGTIRAAGVPDATLELVHLRVSQINGCAFCVDTGTKGLRKNGEPDERIDMLPVWREAPGYSDAERAALALAEAATRIADRPDPVSDEVWAEAARHFDETALAGLVAQIALTNLFNHANVAIRRPVGAW